MDLWLCLRLDVEDDIVLPHAGDAGGEAGVGISSSCIATVCIFLTLTRASRSRCLIRCFCTRRCSLRRVKCLETTTCGFGDDVRIVVREDVVDCRVVVFVGHAVFDQGEEWLEGGER